MKRGIPITVGLVAHLLLCADTRAAREPTDVAEDGWVRTARVVVRDGKGCLHRPLGTFRRGDLLRVVGRERRWLKVDMTGRVGWVYEDALNAHPIDAETGTELGSPADETLPAIAKLGRSNRAGGIFVCRFGGELREMSPADRGGWNAERYRASRGLNGSGLHQVRAGRAELTPERLEQFMADGGVGPPAGDWDRARSPDDEARR